jgi:hypothetical protein
MKKALTLFAILLSMPAAQADDLEGVVCYLANGGYGVRLTSEKSCSYVQFEDMVTKDDFVNLQPGDGLTFTGSKYDDDAVDIESISTIGLYRLLGTWKDTKGRYFKFADYSNVALYDPSSPDQVKTESFNYELYPNSYLRWGVSFTGTKSNRVGLLRQFIDNNSDTHFEICLYTDNLPNQKRVCSTLSRLSN